VVIWNRFILLIWLNYAVIDLVLFDAKVDPLTKSDAI
jgi:hypothetical protein